MKNIKDIKKDLKVDGDYVVIEGNDYLIQEGIDFNNSSIVTYYIIYNGIQYEVR